jgi:cytochrome c553
VTAVGTTISRLTLTGMSRFAHTTAATVDRITADNMKTYQKLEGVDYTYTTSGGNVTGINGSFTAGYPVIITYRTDGRFGRKRSVGDAYQSIYNIVLGDSIELDQSWGKWTGLPLLSGTYTVGLWSYKSIDLTQNGELQTYRNAAKAATKDVLYGTATTVEPREAISSQSNCDACHGDVLFHGGGRRGADACLFCHGESGSGSLAATYDFRTFLHKIHMGKDLTNAATFMSGAFAEIGYPPMPGGAKHCATCHGSDNEAWKTPADRVHASATNKTRSWRAVCGSCHDSDATAAHINLMTDASGTESCSVCHGEGTEQSVELKHKNR